MPTLNMARIISGLLVALWLCAASTMVVTHAAGSEELLSPEQAFRFAARELDDHAVEVRFDIAPGYHLYRERFAFTAQPAGVKLGAPELPPGQVRVDEAFGKPMEIYEGSVIIRVPVEKAPTDGKWTLVVTSQGCADQGVCYPPMKSVYKVRGGKPVGLTGQHERNVPSASSPEIRTDTGNLAQRNLQADEETITGALDARNIPEIAVLFFGLGLLLTFTPPVLLMMPILSAIVVGEHVTRSGAAVVSLAYVLGMAVVYTGLGVASGLLGEGVSAALQSVWVLSIIATWMVALSLSMFGLLALQFPQRWQARMMTSPLRRQGVHATAAAAMGAISALIVAPHVTEPLAGVLTYIAQTGDSVIGSSALFAMALGMGAPLVLVGVGSGNLLPRAGRRVAVTRCALGFLLLGTAIWILRALLPAWMTMLAWAALLLVAAVFLNAFDSLGPETHGLTRLGKGLGLLAALAGAVVLVGLASGGRDPLQPLAGLSAGRRAPDSLASHEPLRFERVRTVAELDVRIAQAAAIGQPVMLDFYADWCVSCKEMERFTFSDAGVRAQLANIVILQADVTRNNADDKALLKRFGLFGPPAIIFFGADGRESPVRVIGFQAPARFLDSVARALGGAERNSARGPSASAPPPAHGQTSPQ
ncbi:protein-disulfide reductase DsbD [Cupriavidus sp. SW-Y-13]|nr:protein-disulfide reductase DsbD [Cupriavidus sp. SW-Y-13]